MKNKKCFIYSDVYSRINSYQIKIKIVERRMNSTAQNGKVLTCIACGSYHHLLNYFPDSWENISNTNYIETDDRHTIENDPEPEPISPVLFTGNNENNSSLLVNLIHHY